MDALTWVASMLYAVALAHWEATLDYCVRMGALEKGI